MIFEKDRACGALIYRLAYLLGIRAVWKILQLIVVPGVLATILTHS
jgi:hypothetical protein